MTRTNTLLVLLGTFLIVALWFVFLFRPASEELAQVEVEVQDAQSQQRELQSQLAQLQAVRADVPSIEAQLAAYRTLVTPDPGLPSLLRQLQVAVQDSGMELRAIAPSEPSPIEELPEIQSISVAIEVSGSYFQLVDFLRRMEEPALSGRAMLVDGFQVDVDEYPTLTVGLNARVFTTGEYGRVAETPGELEAEAQPGATETPTEGATEAETPASAAPEVAQ